LFNSYLSRRRAEAVTSCGGGGRNNRNCARETKTMAASRTATERRKAAIWVQLSVASCVARWGAMSEVAKVVW
jgi:hypothetical protein